MHFMSCELLQQHRLQVLPSLSPLSLVETLKAAISFVKYSPLKILVCVVSSISEYLACMHADQNVCVEVRTVDLHTCQVSTLVPIETIGAP